MVRNIYWVHRSQLWKEEKTRESLQEVMFRLSLEKEQGARQVGRGFLERGDSSSIHRLYLRSFPNSILK